ncbi:MAG: biopolymer transporter ExbD [Pirellulales bacterium]
MKVPRLTRGGSVGINMTPLIDVVFQLLIFFLVSSHLAKQETQLALPLPTALSGQSVDPNDDRPRATLNVLFDGSLLLFGRAVPKEELPQRLALLVKEQGGEVELRVRADRDVPYKHVEPLLVACARAGLSNVTFAVVDETAGGAAPP